MNPTQRGKLSELLVLTRLVEENYQVAIPFGNQSGWDLLVEIDGVWEKWQIKTAWQNADRTELRVSCYSGGGKRKRQYEKGEFDYLIAVHPETNRMWKFPFNSLNKKTITINKGKEL